MTILYLAIALMLGGQTPQKQKTQPLPTVTVCSQPEPKRPSLLRVDADGKCPKDYKGMEGTDKKIMYCVNTYHPKPAQCKPAKVQ